MKEICSFCGDLVESEFIDVIEDHIMACRDVWISGTSLEDRIKALKETIFTCEERAGIKAIQATMTPHGEVYITACEPETLLEESPREGP